jgi:transcriptional regulator GlxA family with amidase domain
MGTVHVCALLYDGVDLLDVSGPVNVFATAQQIAASEPSTPVPDLQLSTATVGPSYEVSVMGGLHLVARHTVESAPLPDILFIPGGNTAGVEADKTLQAWLRVTRGTADLIASVGTGAFVLAEAGLLRGPVAMHARAIPALTRRFSGLDVRDDVPYVDGGDVATSAAATAGIDLSLHIVKRYAGSNLARAVARHMNYDWTPELGEEIPPPTGERII